MPELFAFVDIEKVDKSETVEAVNTLNRNDELFEDDDQNLNRMLGYNKSLLLSQGWGLSNSYQYMPLNMVEKQVYQTN